MSKLLNEIVVCKTTDGKPMWVGKAFGYYEEPTYVVELENGEQKVWSAALCEPADDVAKGLWWKLRGVVNNLRHNFVGEDVSR